MIFSELQQRGLIYQKTDESVQKRLESPVTFYCGFDPTSDSLHLGSLLPLLIARRFQMAGHRPILVLGGATGMIGDPSGKSQERSLLTMDQIQNNLRGIRKTFEKFLDFGNQSGARIVNNLDWMESMSVIDYLRNVGNHFSVNMMMGKDSVKARLENRDQGISYTEFSYMLLQSYDFYHLWKNFQCELQIGGSDQWGNIVAGVDFIRRMNVHQSQNLSAFGMTFPLVTKSDGSKFGKTERGNIWLDSHKTSPFSFYQFFLQVANSDILNLLKYFSFKPLKEIMEIEQEFVKVPEQRLAQKILAGELTTLVHSASELTRVEKATQALFQGNIRSLDMQSLSDDFHEAPTQAVERVLYQQQSLIDILVLLGACPSRGLARKDIESGAISVNDQKIADINMKSADMELLHNQVLIIRRGKKNYFCLKVIS